MRLVFRLLSVLLFACMALAVAPCTLASQQPTPGLTTAAPPQTEDIPSAPQPQNAVSTVEPGDGGQAQQPRSAHGASTAPNKPAPATLPPGSQTASIGGTVIDDNDDLVPDATVILEGPASSDRRTATADTNGSFAFAGLIPGASYRVTVRAKGFINWTSPPVVLAPAQFLLLSDVRLRLQGQQVSVTVHGSTEQIATEQIRLEEQQRILGIIPNFYVSYDPNAVAMTTKLKFKLALRVSVDPVNFFGVAFLAGIDQAAVIPSYPQGLKGYGERVGAVYADGFTDIMFGGAILPWIFHQDPRYFYQGTGSNKSRALHALSNPFICKGDNGKWQPNYSSVGGDLISSAASNLYYPRADRGVGIVFENFAINTGERLMSSLIQEFLIRKLTPSEKRKDKAAASAARE